jgi:FixJ family two-component response regulator
MRAGAVEFLSKPFRGQDLLDAIQLAINRGRVRRGYSVGPSRRRRGAEEIEKLRVAPTDTSRIRNGLASRNYFLS